LTSVASAGEYPPPDPFSLDGRVAVVIGASGAIGSSISSALGRAGASVALLGRREETLVSVCSNLAAASVDAASFPVDTLDPAGLARTRDAIQNRWGSIDILVNAAGGNVPAATLADAASPFEIDIASYRDVLELNFVGPLTAINVFGPALATSRATDRAILNVSSMAAGRAVSRVGGYGASKAAIDNITRWLAVELARRGTGIRVNAIAPGFFIGLQNRRLLLNDDDSLTDRGRAVIDSTPMGRFGEPWEIASASVWLCSPGAQFVTGIVVPVDGGFSAFTGV
jgi:NAD(P)-dependent dehydrogenase (short-subunit alcohol dehydrogenase family)